PGIVGGEYGVARQYDIPDFLGELRGPSLRLRRAAIDEIVRDCLGFDERIRHDATEEILRTANIEADRFIAHQRVIRNKEGRAHVVVCAVAATEPTMLELRDILCHCGKRASLVGLLSWACNGAP